ncbi:hypothetical protein B0T24DRAFT_259165 [Lasiosphaeria ovina]|uniref:Uncharacterized protein n=1 Tax=Lasiosphaeria ovina TaxID=92902 RepID=A0AAE0N784_9PEZI|nr:hypothetical protein B0T24DRAFT_259165 [Lasiosphaeria ovina]
MATGNTGNSWHGRTEKKRDNGGESRMVLWRPSATQSRLGDTNRRGWMRSEGARKKIRRSLCLGGERGEKTFALLDNYTLPHFERCFFSPEIESDGGGPTGKGFEFGVVCKCGEQVSYIMYVQSGRVVEGGPRSGPGGCAGVSLAAALGHPIIISSLAPSLFPNVIVIPDVFPGPALLSCHTPTTTLSQELRKVFTTLARRQQPARGERRCLVA